MYMNLNIVGYIIYFVFTSIIIFKVGNICYHNGNVFICGLLENEVNLSMQVNKLLLMGYYLLNIGYSALTLIAWETIETPLALVGAIAKKASSIVLIIAVLHYLNIFWVSKFIHKLSSLQKTS